FFSSRRRHTRFSRDWSSDVCSSDLRGVIIWGNHSATQFPDLAHATVNGRPALEQVPEAWYRDEFIPTVQQRGAAIIKARGASSRSEERRVGKEGVAVWAAE